MSEPLLQIHDYWTYPDRFNVVAPWWKGHDMSGEFTETVLPRLAVIVTADGQPAGFLACDMSNSIGKAVIEFAMTPPGQSFKDSRRALHFAQTAIFSTLKANDYGLVQAFTSPAVARTLENSGWSVVTDGLVHLIKEI